ncbi:ABC transporter [Clostridiales bacterium PH28_bin88]|nr:ABC transporter [Clostridiales bacterium PH28_bin88]
MLKLENVETFYGQSKVLQGTSLEVNPGEVVALLGRNGAGKTTTMRSIMGLTPPRSGSIRFEDREIAGKSPHEIARLGIGYVPDDRRIFPDLSVEDNLLLAARLARAELARVWSLERVYEIFPILRDFRRRKGILLSGGQQKMLALGRALMQQPKLLLLDEATEGLAPLIVKDFIRVLREVRQTGITILMADQNLKFARRVAERGYIIDKGRIHHQDRIEVIWQDKELVRQYLAV